MRLPARLIPTAAFLFLCLAASRLPAADCNQNGADDLDDLAAGTSRDCNANAVPDECDMAPGSIAFAPSSQYSPGGAASAVALPDIDGDGDPDLIITNDVNGNAGLFQNRGDGSFAEPVLIPTGGTPRSITVADLDGDGRLDFTCANDEMTSISVLFQRGDRSFAAPRQLPVGAGAREVVAADLEGDRDVDLITANRDSDTVTVLTNQGSGEYAASVHLAAGPRPRVAIVADLDRDGDLDLAGTSRGEQDSPTHLVWVIRNHGAAGFAPAMAIEVGTLPYQLQAGDLDGDGAVDLVSLNVLSEDVSILFNRGDGTFRPRLQLDVGRSPEHLVLADLDGDGDFDIAAAGANIIPQETGETDDVAVLWNQGGRNFAAAVIQEMYGRPFSLAAGDVDGDGDLDLITANQFAGDIAVLAVLPGGRLAPPVHVAVTGLEHPGPVHVTCADLNGDGKPDVVTRNANGRSSSIFLNLSGAAVGLECPDFVRGDVNADGVVSLSDMLMLRRIDFEDPELLRCKDAADLVDDEVVDLCDMVAYEDYLLASSDWTAAIPAPFPAPGHDPTPLAVQFGQHDCPGRYVPPVPGGLRHLPVGCEEYHPVPAAESGDLIRLGSVLGGPGQTLKVPIYLSASVPVEAVQLVVAYDSSLVTLASGHESLSYEGAFFEQFFGKTFRFEREGAGTTVTYLDRPFSSLTVHPAHGVFTVGLSGLLFHAGFAIPPGEDVLLAWIHVTVSGSAVDGTVISLTPTNGPGGLGTGPYRLRNEISSQGEAQYVQVSSLPLLEGALIGIVGDQSFFRADANGDDAVDLSDAVHTLGALFLARGPLDCEDAADANDDGGLDIADPVFTLNFLFSAGIAPPPPGKEKGPDPTPDAISCYRHSRD